MFSLEERQFIITLAKEVIEYYLETGKKPDGCRGLACQTPATGELTEPRACFVTLKKNIVELRGCMGHVEAFQPLYLDIIDNAIAAAFEDDRFFPVTKEELPEIEIEISVLTKPYMIVGAIHESPLPSNKTFAEHVMDAIRVGVDGIILKKGERGATYLPQVWDEMLEKHNFLSSLCLKAGLEPDAWQKPGIEVYTYQVEVIDE